VLPLAAAADSFLTEVGDGGFARLSDADLLAEVRELEVLRRRLATADHVLVAELDRRAPGQHVVALAVIGWFVAVRERAGWADRPTSTTAPCL
jgi:hypothetical protein